MSERGTSRNEPAGVLGTVTAVHVAVFLCATTWALGGNGLWLRPALAAWGSLGGLITLAALKSRKTSDGHALRHLWPFLFFNLLVLASLFTPGFREIKFGGDTMLVSREISAGVPIVAVPGDTIRALWMFDVIYLSCFNLSLVVRRRRTLRGLLLFAMANAFALAVFGTLQKFANADGPFFGLVKIRQPLFFSSFLYHNHWGAFIILMTTVCLALAWHYSRRWHGRGFYATPAFAALVAVFFLAATVPLSGSRSCTLLLALILAGAFIHWLVRAAGRRLRRGAPIAPLLAGAFTAIALGCAGIGFIASRTISLRIALTERQIAEMRAQGGIGDRTELYRDTWNMAMARPWFGWGMASYPHVFMLYNTQQPDSRDRLPRFYSAAHNDWLQALAEHGFIGTALLAMCALAPLAGLRRAHIEHPVPIYLALGCAAILLYAWVEFPFGNVAVVLSWWLCFFSATAYARLPRGGNPDSAGARDVRPNIRSGSIPDSGAEPVHVACPHPSPS